MRGRGKVGPVVAGQKICQRIVIGVGGAEQLGELQRLAAPRSVIATNPQTMKW
jgi:hypothetical protein